MPATLAPRHWSQMPSASRVFGREVVMHGLPGAPAALQWLLRRNCSIAPLQLGQVYLSLCAVSLVISGLFFWQGAPWVLAFAGVELMAVGLAMLVFARHAADKETLTLVGGLLQVEQCIGSRVSRADLDADWVTVEPAAGQGSLVKLSARGQTVRVGRFLRPELRAALAQELRFALRRWPSIHPQHTATKTAPEAAPAPTPDLN
jgi:uncharacterized membrane protein